MAGFFRLDEIAELANAGTLLAFIATAACMMILRKRAPEPRVFRCPQPMLIGSLAIGGCLYLIASLPERHWFDSCSGICSVSACTGVRPVAQPAALGGPGRVSGLTLAEQVAALAHLHAVRRQSMAARRASSSAAGDSMFGASHSPSTHSIWVP